MENGREGLTRAWDRLIVIPLAFLRRIDSLKYTSVVALIFIGYLVVLVVAHLAIGDTIPDRGEVKIFQWQGIVSALSSLPVIVFAYTCHQNVRIATLGVLRIRETDLELADVPDTQRDQ